MDPYSDWLGISPERRPLRPHDLLGLSEYEVDVSRIENAILERTAIVRPYQSGRFGDLATDLLNEIAEAGEKMLTRARQSPAEIERESQQQLLRQPTPMIRPRQVVVRDPGGNTDRIQVTYEAAEPVEETYELEKKTKTVVRRRRKKRLIPRQLLAFAAGVIAVVALWLVSSDNAMRTYWSQKLAGKSKVAQASARIHAVDEPNVRNNQLPAVDEIEQRETVTPASTTSNDKRQDSIASNEARSNAPKPPDPPGNSTIDTATKDTSPAALNLEADQALFPLALRPENATVLVLNRNFNIRGLGKDQQLVVDAVDGNNVELELLIKADGYESLDTKILARPGRNDSLTYALKPSSGTGPAIAIFHVTAAPTNAEIRVLDRPFSIEPNVTDQTLVVKEVDASGAWVSVEVTAPGCETNVRQVYAKRGDNGKLQFDLRKTAAGKKREPPTNADLEGVWQHFVNGQPSGRLTLLRSGFINQPNSKNTWKLERFNLEFRWPNRNAPGHAWIDRCTLTHDGRTWTYSGKNQRGAFISGRKIGN